MSNQISIERFVNDCEYLGNSFEGGRLFYDYWTEVLKNIYPTPYPRYQEWLSTGGIGTGKTTSAVVSLLFNACNLILDEDRHTTFGITADARFIFVIVNPKSSKGIGGTPEWQLCKRMMESSPFFSCSYDVSEKGNMIDFKDAPVSIYSVSKPSEILGFNIAGAIFSTADIEATGKEIDEEGFTQLYHSVLMRLQSRFFRNARDEQIFPGIIHLISLFNQREFIQLVRERIDRVTNNQALNTFWSNSSVMEVKKKVWNYSGTTFPVFLGAQPQILASSDLNQSLESRVVEVPVEMREYFEKDVKTALRDLAGIQVD